MMPVDPPRRAAQFATMSHSPFDARITRSPIPFEADPAAEIDTLFADQPAEVREVLVGTAGCAPYLKGLMETQADWLRDALSAAPEDAIAKVLAKVTPEADSDSALRVTLRIAKQRIALLAGLADLAGVYTLEQVTGALTDLADRATGAAMQFQVAQEIRRGKLPGMTQDDIASAGGLVALAMGKMGAHELNYSSDIDLIMLFDDSKFEGSDFHDARASHVRATRKMSAMLSELTADGYVFRTDLRLRPDPAVTPVCVSMEAAERYYESLGRTWERAAHIKARPCAGDIAAGQAYLTRLRPFIWRKHLDFAAIQDAHDMRLRIREHKGLHGDITVPGHDMKLGRGGIREIEFFTQTRQIIAGGRDETLRVRGTVDGLAALAEKDWVPQDVAQILTRHYRDHREVEHRVQMLRDAQTHDLPSTDAGFDRLARMMGEGDTAALKSRLHAALSQVHSVTEGFFAPDDDAPDSRALTENEAEIVSRWTTYPCLRSTRAVRIFKRLKPDLLTRLADAPKPYDALIQFDGFLKRLPAGVQLFSLFEANPTLVDLIVDIAATAPALAAYLGHNAQVLDAVIGGGFFEDWPGVTALEAELSTRLTKLPDYEARLDGARRWMKEWHFRIGVHLLRGLIPAGEAGMQYSDLADAVIRALWPVVVDNFAAKHGVPPGAGAAIIGMGSMGARTLTAASDLDLIVIYDPRGEEASEGRRPLAPRAYYARLTQAFLTALSAPMAEGRLYEVDMRLRPSGRQGPVATSIDSFRAYQKDEAWTWEHLALTRARVITGSASVATAFDAARAEVMKFDRDPAKILADVIDMRSRIAETKTGGGTLDAKLGAGHLQDVELVVQAVALLSSDAARDPASQIAHGVASGWFTAAQGRAMADSHDLMWRLQAVSKLLSEGPLDLDALGTGGQDLLLRETGAKTGEALVEELESKARAAARAIDEVLASPPA